MKSTANFNLTKRTKTLLAILPFKDADTRHAFKNSMIQAQLASETRMKAEPRKL